jgi:hypothetical protein
MIQKIKYWFFLVLLSLLSHQFLTGLIISDKIPDFWGWKGLVFCFFLSSIVGKIIIDKANKSLEARERVFITSVYLGVKTLTHLTIILIYFWATRAFNLSFILSFFILFLLYTVLDLFFTLGVNKS